MKTLNRKLRRDLQQSWKMLLAVTAVIAVGIGSFIGMLATAGNLQVARSQYYSTCRMADFWIDLKKAPADEVHRLGQLPGISEIRDRLQFKVIVDLETAEKPVSAIVLSLPAVPGTTINGIVIKTGSYFSQDRSNEVIVSEKFANAHDLELGDRIHAIMNEQRKEMIICGTATSAEFVYLTSPGSLVDDPENYGLFYVKRQYLEETFGFEGACNSVTGLFTPEFRGQKNPPILQAYADRLEPFGVFASMPRADQFSHMVLDAEMTQNRTMAFIFPSFFLVVASLIMNVLMSRLAEQQRTIMGTLKALGYSNRDLVVHFLKFGLAAGVSGGVMGAIIGFWMSGALTEMYLDFFSFPRLVNSFYPGLSFLGLLLSVGACSFGTIQGVRRVIRLQPAEAMRPAPPAKGGSILLERWPRFWESLDIQWQMVLRGIIRRKRRTFVAIFSAAMGASIVLLTFGFVNSMDAMIQIQFDKILRSDYHLALSKELGSEVVDEIRRLPGVTAVEAVFAVPCTYEAGHRKKKGGILGILPDSKLTLPTGTDGQRIAVPDTGLLMAEGLMDQLNLQPGDPVRLVPIKGDRRPVTTHVAQGFPSMLGLDVYANYSWLNYLMGESGAVSEVRVSALQNRKQRKIFMRALKEMPNLEAVSDIREQKQVLVDHMDRAMRGTAVVMILFAAVIFFGAILNATLIAIAERQREIATFSAMGYFDRETARLFFRENMLTNVIGSVVGLPLGAATLNGIVTQFQTDAYSIPAVISSSSYLYTIALAVFFVMSAQLAVIHNMRKIDRVEAMNLKE